MKCEKHQILHDPRWPCPECAKENQASPPASCSSAKDAMRRLMAQREKLVEIQPLLVNPTPEATKEARAILAGVELTCIEVDAFLDEQLIREY